MPRDRSDHFATAITQYTTNRATDRARNGREKKNRSRGVHRSNSRSGSPTDQRMRSRLPW